jgi:hypothetical protein
MPTRTHVSPINFRTSIPNAREYTVLLNVPLTSRQIKSLIHGPSHSLSEVREPNPRSISMYWTHKPHQQGSVVSDGERLARDMVYAFSVIKDRSQTKTVIKAMFLKA